MELTTYLIILIIVIAIIFALLYFLTHFFVDAKNEKLRPIAAGLVALVVAAILATVMLPYVTYSNCSPITLFPSSYNVPILSCQQAQNLVIRIAAIAILITIALLVIQALLTLT